MPIPAAIAAVNILNAAGSFWNAAKEYGSINDEVIVTVRGDKMATKKDLYFMAAALAFGQVQRWTATLGGINPPPGMIMMENNLAEMTVTFTIRYNRSLAAIYAASTAIEVAAAPAGLFFLAGGIDVAEVAKDVGVVDAGKTISNLPVLAGPDVNYRGGSWDFAAFGINSTAVNPKTNAPYTETFNGRPILWTSDTCPNPDPINNPAPLARPIKSPNPRPTGDTRSRGSLTTLVFSALSNPGSTDLMQTKFVPNVTEATFAGGS